MGVGVLNTLTVTLEKLNEYVVFTEKSVLFFVCPTIEQHLTLVTSGLLSAQRLIRRLELLDWGQLPPFPIDCRECSSIQGS